MAKSIRDILVSYAQSYGGGLPLTAEEICNATVLWVQQFVPENVANYSVGYLSDIIKGSDTIVVDEAEDGQTLEVHLNYEVIQKLDRAILTPVVNPSVRSVPAVNPSGIVEYIPVPALTTGVYNHYVNLTCRNGDNVYLFTFILTSNDSATYTSFDDFKLRYFDNSVGGTSLTIPSAYIAGAKIGSVSLVIIPSANTCSAYGYVLDRASNTFINLIEQTLSIYSLTSTLL